MIKTVIYISTIVKKTIWESHSKKPILISKFD